MYSVSAYGAMIADRIRIRAYAEALRRVITPDSVVVDLGAGPGLFALLACRYGARRVYAIEPADIIQVAREIAAANGLADRIEFIQAMSTDVTLAERADVIVSDIGGVMPWFEHHLPSIADARQRLLAAGGTLIPSADRVWAAVVEAPEQYAQLTAAWDDCGFGFDMGPARRLAVNTFKSADLTADRLLTPIQTWAMVDYMTVADWSVQSGTRWTASRSGIGHGFLLGLERTLIEGISLNNAPGAASAGDNSIYSTIFLPWETPVPLSAGDDIEAEFRASLVGGEYIWCWNTDVRAGARTSAPKARFSQSTMLETALSPSTLRKASAAYRPSLTDKGRRARFVLDAMNQGLPLGEIASRLSREFGDTSGSDPLSFVAALAREYG
jgi:type I protein arginine methyltransferase